MSTSVFKYIISNILICGISIGFPMLSPTHRQILYILLTRPPLSSDRSQILVRLACMKHAASVRPEPGSNSPLSESYYFNLLPGCLSSLLFCPYHFVFRINKVFVFSAILLSMCFFILQPLQALQRRPNIKTRGLLPSI